MNTKTISKTQVAKPNKASQNGKTPRKNAAKYTALELEAIRLGKEVKKSLEGAKNDFV